MIEVRHWMQSDLPHLQRMAVILTLGITPTDDLRVSDPATIALSAVTNLHTVLGSPGGTAIVGAVEGRPIGFLLIGIQADDRTGQPKGYLADIYVEPEHRGSGLSGQLREAGEQYLRWLGVWRASVWVHAHNPKGRKTATKFGMQPRSVVLAKRISPRSAG